jgi:hypothetical protein
MPAVNKSDCDGIPHGLITKYKIRLENFKARCPSERGTIAILENTIGFIEQAVRNRDDAGVLEATEHFNLTMSMGHCFFEASAEEAARLIDKYEVLTK